MSTSAAQARWEKWRRQRPANLITTNEAASRMGVSTTIIKTWVRLGLVTNYGGGGKGSVALYDPDEVRTAPDRRINLRARGKCSRDDCDELHWGKGLCKSHYEKKRWADGTKPKSKPSTPSQNAEWILCNGGVLKPPRSLPYRYVARTCPECGDLLTTPDHLLRRDAGKLPACPRCHVMRVTKNRKRRAAEDADFRRYLHQHTNKNRRKNQARSLEKATNYGKHWTGPELEVAARRDLSARQVAEVLDRSIYAVKAQRVLLRTDPKKINVAGIARERP